MRATTVAPIVIIAAPLGQFDELGKAVKEAGFESKVVRGQYKGEMENALLFMVNPLNDMAEVERLRVKFKQETVLYRDQWGEAWLMGADGLRTHLGHFTTCSKDEAASQDHTVDPETEIHYICKRGN